MNRFDESFVYLVDLLETQTQATLVLKHILMLPLEMAPRDHIMEHILMLALRNFDASSPDASSLGNMKCFFVEREVGEGRAARVYGKGRQRSERDRERDGR